MSVAAPDTSRTPIPTYRIDLDGLRGIAIALVAVFHIWFGRVSGGVDVFLTLSGYFFVGSLLRHVIVSAPEGTALGRAINPFPRLTRLVRRLLPAMVTVLVGVLVGTVLVLPETRWLTVGQEIWASLFYYQNWHLAFNSQDYLAASSANSPLQHLWSMSVQGQFFVLMLLCALALGGVLKIAGRAFPMLTRPTTVRVIFGLAILAVAAVSFYWAQMREGVNQPFNYYDTIARLWEPLAGGLLAIWMPKWRLPFWLRNAMVALALALIVSSGFWIDGVNSYPGPLALVPALSTLLVIWAGATAISGQAGGDRARSFSHPHLPVLNALLASRAAVWLGSISYSLYLWHWPLLIFYLTWREKDHANVVEGAVLLAGSVALAWLTKKFIEDPLRAPSKGRSTRTAGPRHAKKPVRAKLIGYSTVATVFVAVAAVALAGSVKAWEYRMANTTVDTTNLDPRVYPGARAYLNGWAVPRIDPQPSLLELSKDLPKTSYDGKISNFPDSGIHVGVYGDPNATRTIALAGGSHAEFWITALDALGKRNGFKIKTYLKMGCPLTTDPRPKKPDGTFYPECPGWIDRVMTMILDDKPDAVFTNSTRPTADLETEETPAGYVGIFKRFGDAGIPVLGIRDSVWPHRDGRSFNTPDCLANGGDAESCSTPASTLKPVDPIREFLPELPTMYPLDLSKAMCNAQSCPAIVGNIIVYHDWHHLSATFVRSMTDELGRQMKDALPWTGGEGER